MPTDFLQLVTSNIWAFFLIVVFFGGSIFVHELGHFLAARSRGVHVERFSIGFGPKICAWKKNGVEYRLSWLPLGGYVALPQLADMAAIEGESSTDFSKLPPITYTTRIIVFAAGAFFNILFAFALACIVWVVGQPTSSDLNTTRIGSVLEQIELADKTKVTSPASQAGLKPGDTIRSIDGRKIETWIDLQQALATGSGRSPDGKPKVVFSIDRSGVTTDVTIFPILAGEEQNRMVGISPAEELTLGEVTPGSVGQQIGLLPDDRITSYDGNELFVLRAFVEHLTKNNNRPVAIGVRRADASLTLTVPARPGKTDIEDLGLKRRSSLIVLHPNPIEQITEKVVMTFQTLGALINPKSDVGVSKLSGPVGIIRIFHATAQSDIRLALWFTILINVSLAIFNLLPIPVLDGGHMVFATIAKLRGKPIPFNFIATTQSVFMVLLFSMIIYVSFFDVRRWARDVKADRADQKQKTEQTAKPVPAPATP